MVNLILAWSFSHFISILLLIRGIGVGTTWIWTSLYSQPFCTKLSSPSDLEIILQISMHPKVLLVVHVLSEDNTIYRNDLLLSWVWTDPWLFIPQRGPQLVLFIIILDQLNMSNYLWELLFNSPQLVILEDQTPLLSKLGMLRGDGTFALPSVWKGIEAKLHT